MPVVLLLLFSLLVWRFGWTIALIFSAVIFIGAFFSKVTGIGFGRHQKPPTPQK